MFGVLSCAKLNIRRFCAGLSSDSLFWRECAYISLVKSATSNNQMISFLSYVNVDLNEIFTLPCWECFNSISLSFTFFNNMHEWCNRCFCLSISHRMIYYSVPLSFHLSPHPRFLPHQTGHRQTLSVSLLARITFKSHFKVQHNDFLRSLPNSVLIKAVIWWDLESKKASEYVQDIYWTFLFPLIAQWFVIGKLFIGN